MNKKTSQKIQISKSAADLYLKNPRFTMSALADASETDVDLLYEYFPNRQSVLEFFYEGVLIEYQEITKKIDGYNKYTLAEKLSNLAFTLTDLMKDYREFVKQTYRKLIVCSSRNPAFNQAFKVQLKTIYENDTKQSSLSSALNSKLLYRAGLTNFHILIKFWTEDESTGNQKTMELVDKWTAFVQEIHYTSILDRGFDFAKFIFYNSPFKQGCSTSNCKNKS